MARSVKSEIDFKAAVSSIRKFCRKYLPHLFPREFASCYSTIEEDIQRGEQRVGNMLPREHGKTSFAIGVCVYLISTWNWLVHHGNPERDEQLAYLSVTDEVAQARARQVRFELENNAALIRDFGPFERGKVWTDEEFFVAGAKQVVHPTMKAKGILSLKPGSRFTLAMIDDPTDPQHVRSVTQRDKLSHAINNVLEPSMLDQAPIYAWWTPWHPDDEPIRWAADKVKLTRRFRALLNEDAGAVLWPDQWSLERLLNKRRSIGPLAFAQQYQCDPYDPENVALPAMKTYNRKEVVFRNGYYEWRDERLIIGIGVDPAVKGKEQNDRWGIPVVGMRPSNGDMVVLNAYGGHVDVWKGMELVNAAWRKYHAEFVVVEANMFQKLLVDLFQRFTNIPVEPIESITDKHGRIFTTLNPQAHNGKLYFPEIGDGPEDECLRQMQIEWDTFQGEHDDFLDGFQFVVQRLVSGTMVGAASIMARAKRILAGSMIGTGY